MVTMTQAENGDMTTATVPQARMGNGAALPSQMIQAVRSSCPESRILIVMTGGTICMRPSPEGLVPARGFLQEAMAPRPSFNDGSDGGELPHSYCHLFLSYYLIFSSSWIFLFLKLRSSPE